jgi:hypothetical protein
MTAERALRTLETADLRGHRREVRVAFDKARRAVQDARDTADEVASPTLGMWP